jgi:NodT family efflux transporter outer membrane factor (OMF) lipoprotein
MLTKETQAMSIRALCDLLMWGALTITGCATPFHGGHHASPRNAADLQLAATLEPVRTNDGAWPEVTWWNTFGDPQLDQLEQEALAGSPTLATAKARLDRAVAAAGSARSNLWPKADLNAKGTRQRFSGQDVIPPPYAGTTRTESRVALDFSYELDFWGKNRAAIAAALNRADAAQADAFAARLILTTAVARTYVQLARAYDHLDIARDTLAQREHIFELTRQRVDAGLDTRVELKEAEGAVPAAREDVAAIEESLQVARNQLAALLGQGPDRGLTVERPTLQSTLGEAMLPSRLPADLLGRRPDVEASRLRVEAAVQDVKVARARFYPDINLLAFAGFQSIGLSQLAEAGSRIAGVGPALHLPLFEGGLLRSELAVSQADYDAAVAQYDATLIEALHELANELAAFRSVASQGTEQQLAMAAAREAYDLATLRYREGVGNYLTVLSAESQVLAQRHLEADLRARALDNHLNLIRTLGGGFDAHAQSLARK